MCRKENRKVNELLLLSRETQQLMYLSSAPLTCMIIKSDSKMIWFQILRLFWAYLFSVFGEHYFQGAVNTPTDNFSSNVCVVVFESFNCVQRLSNSICDIILIMN